tara:strand:- start:1000 stop:1689 length:690 start_codon:yes stop_codon:yes gene_type:complete
MKNFFKGLFLSLLIFVGNLSASPIQAYYCFVTAQPSIIIDAFDENFEKLASKGVSTHRLYEFHLSGEYEFTHCIVTDNSDSDQFEKSLKIMKGSEEGRAILTKLSTVITKEVLNGAGTPIASVGDPVTQTGMLIDVRAKDDKGFVNALTSLMNSSGRQGSITLFEDTFTGVKGRTHYVVIGGSSLDEVLSNFRNTLASPDGEKFLKKAPRLRELMNKSLIYLIKSWEAK